VLFWFTFFLLPSLKPKTKKPHTGKKTKQATKNKSENKQTPAIADSMETSKTFYRQPFLMQGWMSVSEKPQFRAYSRPLNNIMFNNR